MPIPGFSASFNSSNPHFSVNSIEWGPSTAGPPGLTLTLTNNETGDTVTLSGGDMPSGANVTITQTIDQPNRWLRSGIIIFPSFWGATFSLGTGNAGGGGYGFNSALAEGSSINFFLADGLISVANATATHNLSGHNLSFQISPVNVTVRNWTVDLKKNDVVLRSFPPTTDARGPGVATGTNPIAVSMDWDGRDGNGNPVTGNVTWVMSAYTTDFVTGGPVNDGMKSAQLTLNDSIQGPTGEVKALFADTIDMLDVKNQPITTPQYDVDRGRKEPFALPIRKTGIDDIEARIQMNLPPDAEPQAYLYWGETPERDIVFGPSQHTPINGLNRITLVFNFTKIAKYPQIKWYCAPKSGNEILSLGTTDSPV